MSIVHTSSYADVDIPEIPLTDYVLRTAQTDPDRAAMIDGPTGRTITYGGLLDLVSRFAGGLQSRGFAQNDVIGLMAPNIPEYAVVFHGTSVAGGTVTTINPTYGAEEVRFQLNDAGAKMLVTIPMFAEVATEAIEGTAVSEIFIIGGEGDQDFTQLFGEPAEQVPVDVRSQVVVLPYSSGTTGLPKGVMLSHHNLVSNLAQCEPVLPLEEGAKALAVLPFFHIYGMQVLMNFILSQGGTVITMPRFDLVPALELIEQHKITHFYAVPPIVLALAKHPVVEDHDLSSLVQVFSGAAPLSAELANEASARIDCEVVQGYGMTELSPVTHATGMGMFKPGSSGVTIPNTECRIVDDEGNDQPVDAEGELWVRGPQVMLGYLNNAEATEHTIDSDGWLHTGDVAVIDADGHVYIVDRVKELIKFKGFQVPPAELEGLLLTHPAVADAAVIGVADDEAGELPKGFIALKPGAEATAEEIQAFVAEHVASYKKLRLVEFIDEIPKSASGKILRRFLRDQS